MRRVSPLTYVADIGEQISVRVIQSTGIADLVSYSIGGAPNPGAIPKNNTCTLQISQPVLLGQACFFTDPSGGSFTTQVSGAAGGEAPDHVPFDRAGTEAFHTLIYTFLTPADFANLGPDQAAIPISQLVSTSNIKPPKKRSKSRASKQKKGRK